MSVIFSCSHLELKQEMEKIKGSEVNLNRPVILSIYKTGLVIEYNLKSGEKKSLELGEEREQLVLVKILGQREVIHYLALFKDLVRERENIRIVVWGLNYYLVYRDTEEKLN